MSKEPKCLLHCLGEGSCSHLLNSMEPVIWKEFPAILCAAGSPAGKGCSLLGNTLPAGDLGDFRKGAAYSQKPCWDAGGSISNMPTGSHNKIFHKRHRLHSPEGNKLRVPLRYCVNDQLFTSCSGLAQASPRRLRKRPCTDLLYFAECLLGLVCKWLCFCCSS